MGNEKGQALATEYPVCNRIRGHMTSIVGTDSLSVTVDCSTSNSQGAEGSGWRIQIARWRVRKSWSNAEREKQKRREEGF
ncbi:hypothetical protein R1flu_002427 [Riccia fluitans]|uniref:Uncharacterized protein n=1 Tax=Riccia fluitans TaxID=41844 RepID=A0ABD1Y911_9MARC